MLREVRIRRGNPDATAVSITHDLASARRLGKGPDRPLNAEHDRAIVIAALVTGITGSYGEAEDRIGRIARHVVDHFDGATQKAAPPTTPPPPRRVIQPKGYKPTPSPLTPGIMIGDTLYLSGSTGGDPATSQLVSGGFEAEMRQIMSNMQTVLKEAGLTLADVYAHL